MSAVILFLLLIILIVIAAILLVSISEDYAFPLTSREPTIGGSEIMERKKVYVVDGLNFIYKEFLTANKLTTHDNESDNIISNYPNILYMWKALSMLRDKYKNEHIVFIIKNQDGYKLSVYEDKLYKKWAKTYKLGIILCYDSNVLNGPHYVKARDDKTVCEIYDKYKSLKIDTELISNDTYSDRADYGSVPEYKKIKYGTIPYLSV